MVVPEYHTKVGEASTKYQPKLSCHLTSVRMATVRLRKKECLVEVCVWITRATLGNSMQTQDTKISWVWWQRPVVPAQGGREKALSKFKASFSDQPDRSKVKDQRERLSDRTMSTCENPALKHQQKVNNLSPTKPNNASKQHPKEKSKLYNPAIPLLDICLKEILTTVVTWIKMAPVDP